MKATLIAQYQILLAQTRNALEAEQLRLSEMQAEAEATQKRLDGLNSAATSIEMGVEALQSAPEIIMSVTKPTRRVGPIPRGKGTEAGLDILRETEKPVSVPELALQVFARFQVAEPSQLETKSLEGNLAKSLQNAVGRGFVTCHATDPKTYSSAHK